MRHSEAVQSSTFRAPARSSRTASLPSAPGGSVHAERRAFRLRVHSALLRFSESDAAGGVVLMTVAAIAFLVANSPLSAGYFAIFEVSLLGMSIRHWINDRLMALFFLLVGLGIKREVLDGQACSSTRACPPSPDSWC